MNEDLFKNVVVRGDGTYSGTHYYYRDKFGNETKMSPGLVNEYLDWLEDNKNVEQSKQSKASERAVKQATAAKIKAPKVKGPKYSNQFRDGIPQNRVWGKTILNTKAAKIRGGAEVSPGKYYWRRPQYKTSTGNTKSFNKEIQVGTDRTRRFGKKPKKVKNDGYVLEGTSGWVRHLGITMHQFAISGEQFRMMMAERAIKVFQESFKHKKFNTAGGHKWPKLATYTIKKRRMRGTLSGGILVEYSDLKNSFKIDKNYKGNMTSVYTDKVPANEGHHKRRTLCYAGFHNQGAGTYGDGWGGRRVPKRYKRRQFMGHSTKLSFNTDVFVKEMTRLFLFDNVFLMIKT